MDEQLLERIAICAEEQLKWTKFLALSRLKEVITENLISDKEKLVYQESDGQKSTRELERLSGVNKDKISALWRKWYYLGIMERSSKYEGRRMARIFSLADIGIDFHSPNITPSPPLSTNPDQTVEDVLD